jgi:hypothetical protein
MSGDSDTNLQNAQRWQPRSSCRYDHAACRYRYKASSDVSHYRVRLVSAADNPNGDGTFTEAGFGQTGGLQVKAI